MGDFNAPILPSPFVPYSVNVKENRNTPSLRSSYPARTSFKPVNTLFRKHRSQLLSFYGPNKRRVTLDYILLRPKWIKSVADCVATTPLAIASDHNLLMIKKLKWRLKNNVMLPSKPKYSYANLRRLPQFSDHVTNATNHLVTNHILQNYTFDPALGLENYSRFSAAIKNSVELNLPYLPPFRKRQPWLDVELTKLRLQYSQSRARSGIFLQNLLLIRRP